MTKQTKMNDKYVGVFPFAFDEKSGGIEEAVVIPSMIHLIPVGQWEHELYGPILINASDVREFVQNFNANIRKGVPITAGHEGFNELPAVGWVKEVYAKDDGLWGKIEWNNLGEETLEDKQYKFFSPEFFRDYEDPQSHQIYRNVLTGGALTKSPYFKELEAIVFSEPKYKFNNKTDMQLKDLVVKDITTLTDAEKAFIIEHKAELTAEEATALTSIIDVETAEQKEAREKKEADDKKVADEKATGDANEAAGLNRDGSAKTTPVVEQPKVEGSDKVMITASELAILRKKADEGQQAFAELQEAKVTAVVKAMIFSESNKAGKFLPKSEVTLKTFMATLNDAQRVSFSTLLNELPKNNIFSEVGDGSAKEATTTSEIETLVTAKQTANPKMKYSDALKAVLSEVKGLEQRYDEGLTPVSKAVKA